MNREQLTRRDWLLIAVCVAIAAVSIFVVVNWFGAAFPEASIEFRYDRASSEKLASGVLAEQLIDARGMKHSATFDSDDEARIFLERSLGLKKTNEILKRDVRLWAWSHRWFRPLQEEEFRVDVAPATSMAGSVVNITVTALDANNHLVPGFTGPVSFSSTDARPTWFHTLPMYNSDTQPVS